MQGRSDNMTAKAESRKKIILGKTLLFSFQIPNEQWFTVQDQSQGYFKVKFSKKWKTWIWHIFVFFLKLIWHHLPF